MARHTWHKAPNRSKDGAFLALTPTTRYVVRHFDELLANGEELRGNVTIIAGWLSLDRRNTREALEAIAVSKVLTVTKEELGKAGTFYTVTDPRAKSKRTPTEAEAYPDRTPSVPRPSPERTPTEAEASPKRVPHTSANDAGFSDSSLLRGEEKRIEERRGGGERDAHAPESLPPAFPEFSSDLEELELFWAGLKGRNPPLSPNEITDMREALAIPGMTLALIKPAVSRMFDAKKARGEPPATFRYFLRGLKDDAQRRGLMATPIPVTAAAGPAPPKPPTKPRITDAAHYRLIVESGFDPNDYENPDEFAPREEAAS